MSEQQGVPTWLVANMRDLRLGPVVRMLRSRLGEHLQGMSDDEVIALGLAAGFPRVLFAGSAAGHIDMTAGVPSTCYTGVRDLMIKLGLIELVKNTPQLTEKGEALRVQYGLLCGGEP